MECSSLLLDDLAWIDFFFFIGIRVSRKSRSSWGIMRDLGGVRKSIHQCWLAKGLGLLCLGFKGVHEDSLGRGQHSSNLVSGIFTTPLLSQSFWPRWASRQFLSLPIIENLLPVTFGYSLSSQAVVMRQLRWKRKWRRSLTRSHKMSSMGAS